jgi:D-3-phosphoglycerate dehydrogenase
VFHGEPLGPDHLLARLDNVLLSAHAGYNTREASMTLMRRALDIVRDLSASG